jgi:hypothetical protein
MTDGHLATVDVELVVGDAEFALEHDRHPTKASLTSNRSMSSIPRPLLFSALRVASGIAENWMTGSQSRCGRTTCRKR